MPMWMRRRIINTFAFLTVFVITLLMGVLPVSAASRREPAAAAETSAPESEIEPSGKPDASDAAEQESEHGSSSSVPAGTAVLVGAGAYTYVRTKSREKKKEQKYEYFENHTQNGTLREEEKWYQG